MSTALNALEFLYHLILHGKIMLNKALLAKLIKQGLVSLIALSIYYISVQAFFFCNSLVMPLFDLADLIYLGRQALCNLNAQLRQTSLFICYVCARHSLSGFH